MPMQSTNLLPALRELPGEAYGRRRPFQEMMSDLVGADRAMFAAESASAASLGLWAIFDSVNVDDSLAQAYAAQYPSLAADHSLYEHYQEMLDRGPESVSGFISGIKGKVAEINTADMLEQNGFTGVEIAANPTQPVWDISAIDPGGESVFFQVKTGSEGYAGDVTDAISDAPDIHFLVSSEIYDHIADNSPELLDSATDIGADYALVDGMQDGLDTLSSNLGIDVPDGIGDILPYAGAIIAGARLVYGALRAEREFKAVDRTTRNKIQVVQALTTMSRISVTAVLSAAGAAAGSVAPLVGNLVGDIVGSPTGAGIGDYLNRHLQPYMLDLALDITGLTRDDLFYYKNKPRIDQLALSFRSAANQMAALPAG